MSVANNPSFLLVWVAQIKVRSEIKIVNNLVFYSNLLS